MATKRLLLGFNLPNTETDAHKSEYENAKKTFAMHEIYTRIFGSSFKLIPNQKRLVRFYNVEQTPLPI